MKKNQGISKKCSKCKEIKPLSEFHKDKSKKDGHASSCKICRRQYHHYQGESYRGFVYFVQMGKLPYYKIGFTRDLMARLTQLEDGLPLLLHLIASTKFNSARDIEKALQQKFVKKRTRGEWFKLAKKDVDFIKHLFKTPDGLIP